ncbi:MAG: hypothetical protein L3J88_14520 [Gammaproteobacteria bacterium]|nr:hypothetical protein [Gammaproteobacteria bacterium]MCF6364527.1 hypothetical protein [Gammaproteobacteria bacterium]
MAESRGRVVVADTGPLIAFARLDLLALLPDMLGILLVPDVVLSECLYVPSRPDAKAIQRAMDAGLLEIRAAQFSLADDWPSALGMGEQAAIHLAQKLGCQILMDDKLARRTAASMELHVIGTAEVLIKAKRLARIEAVAPLLHTLQASGYHLGTCTK